MKVMRMDAVTACKEILDVFVTENKLDRMAAKSEKARDRTDRSHRAGSSRKQIENLPAFRMITRQRGPAEPLQLP